MILTIFEMFRFFLLNNFFYLVISTIVDGYIFHIDPRIDHLLNDFVHPVVGRPEQRGRVAAVCSLGHRVNFGPGADQQQRSLLLSSLQGQFKYPSFPQTSEILFLLR